VYQIEVPSGFADFLSEFASEHFGEDLVDRNKRYRVALFANSFALAFINFLIYEIDACRFYFVSFDTNEVKSFVK